MDQENSVDSLLNKDILYWIGLSDYAHEGTWRWQESHQLPPYTNWASDQPDHGTDQNCAVKTWYHDYEGKWHDWICNSNYATGHGPVHALCQMEI